MPREPIMWWHADLPAALPGFGTTSETPSEPDAQGEFLLEWILPTLSEDLGANRDPKAGAERRALRRRLRDQDED